MIMSEALKRIEAVDVFRGIIVIKFLFSNALGSFTREREIPFALKHNQGNALLLSDFTAALFAFLIGIGLAISYSRRIAKGQKLSEIFIAYAKRFGMLLVVGLILDSVSYSKLTTQNPELIVAWGVLQTLAVAGAIAALTILFSNAIRIAIALVILLVYGYLLLNNASFFDLINKSLHGGPVGAISFGAISIFGLIAGSIVLQKSEWQKLQKLSLIAIALFALAMFVSTIIPFNKLLVTPSYSLITSAVGFALMAIIYYMVEIKKVNSSIIKKFGANALFAWIIQYPLIYYPLGKLYKFQFASFLEGMALSLAFVIVVYVLIIFAEKKGIRLAL